MRNPLSALIVGGPGHGNSIPQLDFGAFQIEPEDAAEAVGKALDAATAIPDT